MNNQYQDPDLTFGDQVGTEGGGLTVYLFGGIGTMKTTWAGLAPKPLFLSIGPEGGDDALRMLPILYGAPIPPVYHIKNTDMMQEKIERIRRDYKQMDINTVVIDSLTYYQDMQIAQMSAKKSLDPKMQAQFDRIGIDATSLTTRDWGFIFAHLRDLAMKLHGTPLNVIWILLEKENKTNDEQMGASRVTSVEPYIKGEIAKKLPGLCKMVIHAKKDLIPDPNVMGRSIAIPKFWTSPNMLTDIVRHKYGNLFPEGCLVDSKFGTFPTWEAIHQRIGNVVYKT